MSAIKAAAGMVQSMLGPSRSLKQIVVPNSAEDSSIECTPEGFLRSIELFGPARSMLLGAIDGQVNICPL